MFGISVTADLVGTGVQNLRLYERKGLVEPARSAGGTRLYSADDIARLNRITDLLAEGLNLAGIAMVLDLEADNTRLRADQQRLLDEGQPLRPKETRQPPGSGTKSNPS